MLKIQGKSFRRFAKRFSHKDKMSIYSSVTCPKCREKELSLATAFSWNKIRLSCTEECGYDEEIKLTNEQSDELRIILNKRKEESEEN